MDTLQKLERSFSFWFLFIVSSIFSLLRFPSFFEPYWYGDEGVYEVLAYGIRHGRLLYQGIWDNKPPLLYLIYALFDGNQPYVRIFSFLVGLVAIYFFYTLSKRLFQKKISTAIATGVFTMFLGLPLLEGNIANAENFMVLPTIAAIYILIRCIQEKKQKLLTLFAIGFLLGISFLIKVVAVFDFSVAFLVFGFIFFAWNKKQIIQLFLNLLSLSIGFFLPLLLTIGFFALKGALHTFIQSAFLSNVGYVGYGNQLFLPFTKIAIPQGFLLLKLLFLIIIIFILFLKRKSMTLTQLLIYLWIPFSVFNAFFSGRPYTHYLLVLISSFSLLIGLLFERKSQVLSLIFIFITIILIAFNFPLYNKTIGYYKNFVSFTTGHETVNQYQSFFDSGVPRDYAVADFLTTSVNANQKIFLWTNSAQLYYLIHRLPLGRYTVAYHVMANQTTIHETQNILAKTNPDFIVILPNAQTFPFAMTDYRLRAEIDGGLIYEKLF